MTIRDVITGWSRSRVHDTEVFQALSLLDETIAHYNLHDSDEIIPVRLVPMLDTLGIERIPLEGSGDTLGVTFCDPDTKRIAIAVRPQPPTARDTLLYAFGHETTHALSHRIEIGNERYCRARAVLSSWDDLAERVADEGAARLLVPINAVKLGFAWGWNLDQIARALYVPRELVRLRITQEYRWS